MKKQYIVESSTADIVNKFQDEIKPYIDILNSEEKLKTNKIIVDEKGNISFFNPMTKLQEEALLCINYIKDNYRKNYNVNF